MKKPIFKWAADNGAGGGDMNPIEPTEEPVITAQAMTAQKTTPLPKPVFNETYNNHTYYSDDSYKAQIREEIKNELLNEFKEQQKAEMQKQKDKELEDLKKQKAEYEKKLADIEANKKIDEYNNSFKDFATKEGASKTDQLLRLANRELSPEEAVADLKKSLPELFIKTPSLQQIGGGVKGDTYNSMTAEDVSKMSMDEYKKWRQGENK